jgi:hypothetical protein
MPNDSNAGVANDLGQSRRGGPAGQGALVIGGLVGMALGPTLITVGEHLGWPAMLEPVFFFGGWVVMLACFAIVWRRGRAFRNR